MLTPRVARAAHWRSLNQDVPTSDVLCRFSGTSRWLQATSPLPLHALLVLRQGDPRALDLPEEPGPPRARPVKDERPNDPRRLPSYRDILTCFRHEDPSARARLGGFARSLAHRFAFVEVSPTVSVSAGNSAFGTTIPLGLGRVSRLRLATHQGARSRCVRSMSATQHSKERVPILGRSRFHRQDLRPACTSRRARIAHERTEESSVSRRPNRFGGSPGLVGIVRPS